MQVAELQQMQNCCHIVGVGSILLARFPVDLALLSQCPTHDFMAIMNGLLMRLLLLLLPLPFGSHLLPIAEGVVDRYVDVLAVTRLYRRWGLGGG